MTHRCTKEQFEQSLDHIKATLDGKVTNIQTRMGLEALLDKTVSNEFPLGRYYTCGLCGGTVDRAEEK